MKGQEASSKRYIAMAYLTAFVSGFCVMVIEIIAGRLIARYLGASLYTWTSVIGVVLAGISLGNYAGGRIADICPARKTISLLFIAASLSCVLVPVFNNIFGNSVTLVRFSWPVRVAAHVGIIFFLPACILGMISPVVAKFALEQGFRTGGTIGNIYAWAAAGSIFGTFVTGFLLIAAIGTVAAVWIVAGILAVMGIAYSKKDAAARLWLFIFILLWVISYAPFGWARTAAANLFLAEPDKESTIYKKDSQFAYIAIERDGQNSGIYNFRLDSLIQTRMNAADPLNLQYAYGCHNLFISIVKNLGTLKDNPWILNLGGGGYLVPRYLKEYFPKSAVAVVEIDPAVTSAAALVLGPLVEGGLKIYHMDARNYIENAVRQNSKGADKTFFDFILSDIFTGGIAIPYHLTTYEYNEKVDSLLSAEGLYVINLIDLRRSPRFLLAMTETLKKTFAHVYLFSAEMSEGLNPNGYGTYVIVASRKEIGAEKIDSIREYGHPLDMEELWRPGGVVPAPLILTDDFAPVDNLLAGAFRVKGEYMEYAKLIDMGVRLTGEKKFNEALLKFESAVRFNPNMPMAYNNIASIMARQARYEEAIRYYQRAVDLDPNLIQAMVGLGNALDRIGRREEAIGVFYRIITVNPALPEVYVSLGNTLFMQGKAEEAIKNYRRALELAPDMEAARRNLNAAIKAQAK